MTDLAYLSATEALRLFRSRQLSPVELMNAVVERAEAVEPAVNALSERTFEEALVGRGHRGTGLWHRVEPHHKQAPAPRRLRACRTAWRQVGPVAPPPARARPGWVAYRQVGKVTGAG
ncbi:hypothetical protein [Nonomuraea sp. NPDC046570]|uniref:hypothetical protein n=1 Tax=Nonomuraea sp. NPDC046570 TaxID=3155255 RepID=UPI0033E2141B